MKKVLLISLAILCSLTAKSQNRISYHGEFDLGYSSGVGTLNIDRFNFNFINGIKIDDYFSIGIGIGTDGYIYAKQIETAMPIFLDIKSYFPFIDNIIPFIAIDCGVGIGLSEYISGLKGVYVSPSIGVHLWEHLKLQIGYQSQRLSIDGMGTNLGAIQLKVGVIF